MPRSRDPRDKLPSQRGAKRTGSIGTILPGDDTEVARDIQRLWWEVNRNKRLAPVKADGKPGVPIDSAYKIPGAGLQYWYRLGEPGPWPVGAISTPNFAIDSSGNNRHLAALNSLSGAVWITDPASAQLPICDVAGALAGGNANDGGIQFRFASGGITSSSPMLCLQGAVPMEAETRDTSRPIGTASTFAAWVAFTGDTGDHPLVSTWSRQFGIGNYGARLYFDSSRVLRYAVGALNLTTGFSWTAGFTSVVNQWHHFVTSIEKVGSDLYRRRVWVDSNRVLELTDTQAVTGSYSTSGAPLTIGGGNTDDIRFFHSPGKVDEVAHWTSALSDAQVVDLWNARVLNEGDTWGGQSYSLPDPLPELPATPTTQDIADALVYLGLATQL